MVPRGTRVAHDARSGGTRWAGDGRCRDICGHARVTVLLLFATTVLAGCSPGGDENGAVAYWFVTTLSDNSWRVPSYADARELVRSVDPHGLDVRDLLRRGCGEWT